MAGKPHHVAYVITPEKYFVRRFLHIDKPHLNGRGKSGAGGGAWGRGRKKAEARRELRLTKEFMEDVERRRWCPMEGMAGEPERLAAIFFSFVKQTHKWICFSDASFEAVRGLCLETGVYWRYNMSEGG